VTKPPDPVRLDLNDPEFQRQLFDLAREGQLQVLRTLERLSRMTWTDVYRDHGLKWEAILSRRGPAGGRLYSLRISRSARAVALREGNWLRLLTLHLEHDSTYGG